MPAVRDAKAREWLAHKVRQETILCSLSAAALALLGAVVVYLTFWIVYGVIWFGFSWLGPSHQTILLASGLVVVLLFVGNASTDREYLEELEFETGDHVAVTVAVARFTGSGWALALTGPQMAHSFVKILVTILYTGPRMLTVAWRLWKRAGRLKRIDVEGCARVLRMLLLAEGRVPFRTMFENDATLDPHELLPQLREIDGVVFLPSEPPGLTLAPFLVEEIRQWKSAAVAAA